MNKKIKAILLLTVELLAFSVLLLWLVGCANTPATVTPKAPVSQFKAKPLYITPEDYEQIKKTMVNSLGANPVILELTEQPEQMSALHGKNAVSFTVDTMPKDLQQLLQRYNRSTGEDFYSYVINYTNRFIFCPSVIPSGESYPVAGMAVTNSQSHVLYYGENITFSSMRDNWKQNFYPSGIIAGIIVHESAHHKLHSLIREGIVYIEAKDHYKTHEHYALIEEVEYLDVLLRDTFKFSSEYFEILYYIRQQENEIEYYNAQLGLPEGDRTLLPGNKE